MQKGILSFLLLLSSQGSFCLSRSGVLQTNQLQFGFNELFLLVPLSVKVSTQPQFLWKKQNNKKKTFFEFEMEVNSFVLKVKYEGHCRRLPIQSKPDSLESLHETIRQAFPRLQSVPFHITYVDEENDRITVGTFQELSTALDCLEDGKVLKLTVHDHREQQKQKMRKHKWRRGLIFLLPLFVFLALDLISFWSFLLMGLGAKLYLRYETQICSRFNQFFQQVSEAFKARAAEVARKRNQARAKAQAQQRANIAFAQSRAEEAAKVAKAKEEEVKAQVQAQIDSKLEEQVKALKVLVDMGFDFQVATAALKVVGNNDVSAALEHLVQV